MTSFKFLNKLHKTMYIFSTILLLSIILTGCNIDKEHQISSQIESAPKIKNNELGVELPANVHTDWEVEETGNGKYVIYYQDPYAKGYPQYKEGVSPDIEEIIFLLDDSVVDDKFCGNWVTGLNEEHNINEWKMKPAPKYDRNKTYSFSSIDILKDSDSGKYKMGINVYFIYGTTDIKLKEIVNSNGVSEPLWEACKGNISRDYNGFNNFYISLNGNIDIEGNKMIANMITTDSEKLQIELLYHPENDTMEVKKFVVDPNTIKHTHIPFDFGLRKHNDVLKRYAWGVSELTAGITQFKYDQLKESHPDLNGYRNLMLKYKHRELIPGTMDLSKPPAMPELP